MKWLEEHLDESLARCDEELASQADVTEISHMSEAELDAELQHVLDTEGTQETKPSTLQPIPTWFSRFSSWLGLQTLAYTSVILLSSYTLFAWWSPQGQGRYKGEKGFHGTSSTPILELAVYTWENNDVQRMLSLDEQCVMSQKLAVGLKSKQSGFVYVLLQDAKGVYVMYPSKDAQPVYLKPMSRFHWVRQQGKILSFQPTTPGWIHVYAFQSRKPLTNISNLLVNNPKTLRRLLKQWSEEGVVMGYSSYRLWAKL